MNYKSPVIYAYRRRSINKIVYIGQTIDLKTRHKVHIKYDPFNLDKCEYNYPLSRGVRKYGEDEYELLILEDNIPLEELNSKEKYYIKLYDTYNNGYNQNGGGGINENFYIYDELKIEQAIDLLKNSNFSFSEISKTTELSMTHLFNLNWGLRRRKENIIYPLRGKEYLTRGRKLTDEDVKEIKNLLKHTKILIKDIETLYNCKSISGINSGRNFKEEGENYPLRSTGLSSQDLELLTEKLLNSVDSFKILGQKYGINDDVVSNINRGITYKREGLNYPIRQKNKIK